MRAPSSANPIPSPDSLLNALGMTEPSEINVETLAGYCGATVVYEPLDGCAAQLFSHDGRAFITIDSTARRARQRFSAGHELGHWMYDRGRVALACTEGNLTRDWHEGSRERRANRYATELLLPTRMFTPRARNLPSTFESARELADAFETSLTATAVRLVELGSHLAMLVCCDQGERKWFLRSKGVPSGLWPIDRLTHNSGSVAARLLAGATRVGPRHVNADEWISHRRAHRYRVHEDSILIMPNVTLTLLWWDDEQQILDLDEDEDREACEPLSGYLSFSRSRTQ